MTETASPWFGPVAGPKRRLTGPFAIAFRLIAAGFAGFYLYTSGFGLVSTESNRGVYLMLTSVLVFLLFPATRRSPTDRATIVDLVWIAAAVITITYWMDQYVSYAMFRVSSPNQTDLIMGAVAIVTMLETSRRVLGSALVFIAVAFLAQLYLGAWLPGKLAHSGMSVERILEFTFSTQEAIFGVVTATFATFVFPFMIFGAFLERSGAGTFFMELGTAVAGRWRGGPAKIAVLTSALFGSISGSSVANTVTTGSFTIPLMKRTGFKPHNAGAIEAIASTGGQFMPPVMGAGVFILATLTQTSYLTIALMNIIPAALFFIFLMLMIDLEALRTGIKGLPPSDIPSVSGVMRRGWFFFLPLVVVIGLLFIGYSPDFGAFWGTVAAFALSWLRRETRMGPRKLFHAMSWAGQSNTSAGAAIGTLGIIIGGIVLAGLGLKFSAVLIDFAGGQLLPAVIMVTLISIIIGMGSSTTGSYIILSVVAAPALVNLGVPLIAAHLAVFYAACLSNITPPVCVSAYAAAAIADSNPMRTGFAALKFGATLVIIPFAFAYTPEILMIGEVPAIVHRTAAFLVGSIALATALQGLSWLGGSLDRGSRAAMIVLAAVLFVPVPLWIDGLALLGVAAIWFMRRSSMAPVAG
ncbi:TRAP transporter fused permease subunit [Fodinicurvata sp. EGI_FJ10296]|uniref:TRAP transporter permease n=1 Tax=Fodinicurvata sp. EGI_FJ10296 TaxID=3231908 RepID=UPI003456F8CB